MTPFNDPDQGSEFKKEWRTFREQATRLVNAILNRWFDLKPASAHRRGVSIIILLILTGFAISLMPHPWREWHDHLQQFFWYVFAFADEFAVINSIFDLIRLGLRAYFNPYVLWYAPAFFLPIFIAYQAASFYLADIFNLEHVSIARRFIRQVALTGSKDVIHIVEGKIAPEDQDSPISRIGGPGKVIVNLDSVALFEKADGRPNVIGPTAKEPKGKATLDGFERFRQALDLRDQFIDLRGLDGKNSAVKSRSRDGIPVSATDVRLMFSMYRDGQTPTAETPYPYTNQSIEQQVYKSTSKVTPNLADRSKLSYDFESSMLSLVRRELGSFMSKNKLTEYLASISWREVETAKAQEKAILEAARLVLEPLESVESVEDSKKKESPPQFTPRHDITNLFSQFTKKFTEDAQDKGVELHWIGVGTWDVPVELVAEKHLDAWRMSRENIYLNSDGEIGKVKDDAKAQKTVSMIQSVPLDIYQTSMSHNLNRDETISGLVREYQRQLIDIFEFQHNNKKRIPPTLAAAITYLYDIIFPPHHGPFQRPPAMNHREANLYNQLMAKIRVEGNTAYKIIEKLIDLEREFNENASREEALERINTDWDLDIAGKWHP